MNICVPVPAGVADGLRPARFSALKRERPLAILRAPRLVLRPLALADAPRIAEFVGDLDVARMLARVPHPYRQADAEAWIASQATPEGSAKEAVFAAALDGALVGACSHIFGKTAGSAEIGYWVGRPYWGQGYATEMTAALLRHGFAARGLGVTTVSHMIDNPASAAVIAKLGFRRTGRRRIGCLARAGEVVVLTYAMTRAEAEAQPWY